MASTKGTDAAAAAARPSVRVARARKAAVGATGATAKTPPVKAATDQAAPAKSVSAKAAPGKAAPAQTAAAKKAAPRVVPGKAVVVDPASDMPPVRPDEEAWTPAELLEVRREIERDIARGLADIRTAEEDLQGLIWDAGDGSGDDQADAGAKTYEREQEISLANISRDKLAQNRHALERLDNGSYGVCESCGLPIGKFRLQAAPRATLCRSCKEKTERG